MPNHPIPILLSLILAGVAVPCRTQTPEWSRLRGGYGNDVANTLAVDSRGNIYVAGHADEEMDSRDEKAAGAVCLIKYDASGKWIWTRRYGKNFHAAPQKIAVDREDNLYLAGGWCPGTANDTAAGEKSDLLLCKFDSTGALLWTRIFGSHGLDNLHGFALGGRGDMYLAGEYCGAWEGRRYRKRGDLILAKFSPEGKPYWTRNIGDSFLSTIADLGLDARDNIHLAGSSILSVDGRRTPTSFLTLKKFDSAGILLWSREFLGHRFPEHVSAIAVAASGQAYLTGVTFRYLTGDSVIMGDPHGYLMEVDSSGAVGFAKLQGTRIIGRGLGLDPKGNILMSGESTVNIERANSNGNQDMFLARYRSDGSRESIQFWGSRFNEWFAGMAVDRKGAAHIAGSSEGSPDGIRNKGSGDIFLVKFAPAKAKK